MQNPSSPPDWDAFVRINERRRAIRDFDGREVDEAVLRRVLSAALLSPSSGNLQPYEFHLVRSPGLKARVAEACNQQRAAQTASALVVVVSSPRIARETLQWQAAGLGQAGLSPKSEAYHRGVQRTLGTFLRWASFPALDGLRGCVSLFLPVLSLLPFGRSGVRQWVARNSLFSVQTMLLAASAHGLDSCPMEGFNALQIGKLLKLPRGSVIPVVVALGRRRGDARVEPQMRRDLQDVLVSH